MAGFSITFTFDSGIEKLTWGTSTPLTAEITASPATVNIGTENVYIKPIFKNGYIIDTFTGVSDAGNGLYRSNIPADRNVSFTSKLGEDSSTKSYDLATSAKWDSLSAGNHSVTIVAKANGYRDSALSTAVTVVKSSAGETWVLNESGLENHSLSKQSIAFTSNGKSYIAIECFYSGSGLFYYTTENDYDAPYFDGGPQGFIWSNQAYRTITFATAPTGDLLTWLQSNGTKQ